MMGVQRAWRKQQDQTFMPQQIGFQLHSNLFTNICQYSEPHGAPQLQMWL